MQSLNEPSRRHALTVLVLVCLHSETPPDENQNLFATLTVRTDVWIVLNWTLQQSMAISMQRRAQVVSYLGETQSLLW